MATIPPPPFHTNVADKLGRMSPEWQRHWLASQQTITTALAPADARYVTLSANPSLTDEFSLATLTTGYLKVGVAGPTASVTSTATLAASDLTGTLPALNGSALTNLSSAALTGALPAISGAALTALPNPLPASSGVNLTSLNASQLTSGTIPSARLGSPLPALDGSALTALNGAAIVWPVRTVTHSDSPYTVVAADWLILADATAGAVTLTLPTATSGRGLVVKKVDSSGNAVQLTGTVDGSVNPTLTAQYSSKAIVADGSTWNAIAVI